MLHSADVSDVFPGESAWLAVASKPGSDLASSARADRAARVTLVVIIAIAVKNSLPFMVAFDLMLSWP